MSVLGKPSENGFVLRIHIDDENDSIRDQDGRILEDVVDYKLNVPKAGDVPTMTVTVLLPPKKYGVPPSSSAALKTIPAIDVKATKNA